MQDILLGVNIDHIATLRNARGTNYPSPVHAADIAERAGADGITVHLREDRRHIHDQDVFLLKETINTRLNFEMAVTDEMLSIAQKVLPAFCCLVPEKRAELTGQYAEAKNDIQAELELKKLIAGIEYADRLGLKVNAGHGLHYHNVKAIAAIPQLIELNIGHAIIARAVFDGLPKAVSDMRMLMQEGRNQGLAMRAVVEGKSSKQA